MICTEMKSLVPQFSDDNDRIQRVASHVEIVVHQAESLVHRRAQHGDDRLEQGAGYAPLLAVQLVQFVLVPYVEVLSAYYKNQNENVIRRNSLQFQPHQLFRSLS